MKNLLKRLRPKERFLGLLLALWAALILPHALAQLGSTLAELLTMAAFVSLMARTLAFDERLSPVGHASLWGLVLVEVARQSVSGTGPHAWLLSLELLGVAGVTFEVLRYLTTPGPVTRDKLYAAACGYLLFGFLFAVAYGLAAAVEPQGMSQSLPDRVSMRYFSFVTLSTLGYGDVVPRLPLTRMLAVSEAILGQLYLAVVVALLVGRMGQRSPES